MPDKRRKSRREKKAERREKHNQRRRENSGVAGNISKTEDSKVIVSETENVTVNTDSIISEVKESTMSKPVSITNATEKSGTSEEVKELSTVAAAENSTKTADTCACKEETATDGVKETTADTCTCKEETVDAGVRETAAETKEAEAVTTAGCAKETSHKLYIQYNDLEFSDELMFEAAISAYCNDSGKDKSSVESVNLYVKPQEGKAYYVINNEVEGSIDL